MKIADEKIDLYGDTSLDFNKLLNIIKIMASNSFGTLFRMTTWGESHGKAIGVVVDGCPAGLKLLKEDVQKELDFRRPGRVSWTSERKEEDRVEILSGVFEDLTTGAPISLIIYNQDVKSKSYRSLKDLYRPGHANFTYLEKYKVFDHKGGGRASARETACRVAAGSIAKKLLCYFGIEVVAYLQQVGNVRAENLTEDLQMLKQNTLQSPIFCPCTTTSKAMLETIEAVKQEKDSIGGIVQFVASSVPVGLGNPIYEKLEAKLGSAMLSIPASKGFEIGSGFKAANFKGSSHNDMFTKKEEKVSFKTNNAGGVLAGISNGMPLVGRVVFKPTSSIKKSQKTVSIHQKKQTEFTLEKSARHDPCVAIRAVPVVEAMLALCLADCLLLNQTSHIESIKI